jgi:diamine N-acetyltransferase
MQAVHDAARSRGARTLWLGVWEHNPRAISFYVKCGFRDIGSQDFWVGADRQTDRVMAMAVRDAYATPDGS